MNILTSFFSSGVDKVVKSVSDGLDALFTSDDERLQAKNILHVEMNKFKLQLQEKANDYEKEVTKRWVSDNEHFMTRLVRPLSYIFVLVLFAIMVLCDGNLGQFTINQSYISVIQTLLATMTVAYFGSRGIEKSIKHFKKEK